LNPVLLAGFCWMMLVLKVNHVRHIDAVTVIVAVLPRITSVFVALAVDSGQAAN
jgi:hypothetical protein